MLPPRLGSYSVQLNTNPSTLEPLVKKLGYRSDLDAEDRAAILALPFTVKTLERSQFIVRERELATQSCVMLSGFSIRSKLVVTGNRQIVAIHMKGEAVDLQNSLLKVADHSVQMLTPGRVAMIPREAVVALTLERPNVGQAMWIDTLVDASIFREWIANVGRRDARTRVAHLLCEFSIRLKSASLGHQTDYQLPMTQEELADTTGLTAVHVNRTLKGLQREGLIERPNARAVRVPDWRKLAEVGDFDSNYLHMREHDPAFA
jgi:CRP-like cAMP-binding protein